MTCFSDNNHDIIYQILIDRFAGFSSEYHHPTTEFVGGTINGIISKLSYLRELGITTIWISPFYKTSAYHGYHITDFYAVEPHFGTEKDLMRLIEKVHDFDMHIIADFVPNHCSKHHPFFQDAQRKKNSNFKNWFYFLDWPDKYLCFLSVEELPKINLSFPPARDHIIDAALYWLSKGFDGFRLDHVIGPSHDFWKTFTKKVKDQYPQSILIGEAWMQGIRFNQLKTIQLPWKHLKWLFGSASDWFLKSYQHILDGVLDFKGQQLIKKSIQLDESKEKIMKKFEKHYRRYNSTYLLPLFLDNHDMDRFLFQCGNNKTSLKKAASIQFSIDQPVIIYYGSEIGMSQQQSIWSLPAHGDSLARQPMTWHDIDRDLHQFYINSIAERKKRMKI